MFRYSYLGWVRLNLPAFCGKICAFLVNVDVAGLSVAGLSIREILNGHLGKCPLEIYMS